MTDLSLLTLPHERRLRFSFENSHHFNDDEEEDDPRDTRRICRYFQRGMCNHGARCQFKHVHGARAHSKDKSVVCKHWLRSLCKKGDRCEFLHQYDVRRMSECTFFQNYGKCSNPECLFRHISAEEKIKPCEQYDMGFCPLGPKCPKRHVRKVACPDYMAGFCFRGPKCKFAHPRWDERTLRSDPRKHLENVRCFKCGQQGHYAGSQECPLYVA